MDRLQSATRVNRIVIALKSHRNNVFCDSSHKFYSGSTKARDHL